MWNEFTLQQVDSNQGVEKSQQRPREMEGPEQNLLQWVWILNLIHHNQHVFSLLLCTDFRLMMMKCSIKTYPSECTSLPSVWEFSLTEAPGTEARCNRLFQHLGWLACCSDLSAAGHPANISLHCTPSISSLLLQGPSASAPRRW